MTTKRKQQKPVLVRKTAKYLAPADKPDEPKGLKPSPVALVTDQIKFNMLTPADAREQRRVVITNPVEPAYKTYVQELSWENGRLLYKATKQKARAKLLGGKDASVAVEYLSAPDRVFSVEEVELAGRYGNPLHRLTQAGVIPEGDCRHCLHDVSNGNSMLRQCCFCGGCKITTVSRKRHGKFLSGKVSVNAES